MVGYYKSFARKKKEKKVDSKNWRRKRSDLLCDNKQMLAKWVQIEMGKTLKTMQITTILLI
jgi:hypothetical protein